MSTKFVSKNSNYMIVLRPGVEGNRAIGTHAVPGLYVKFQSGVLDVKEEKVIELLRNHPSFGIDFLEIKQDEIDPYLDVRDESEPAHIHQEIKYGHAEKAKGSSVKTKISPQLKKVIENEAIKMIPGILKSNPKILKDIILDLASQMKKEEGQDEEAQLEKNTEESVKKGPGRPVKTE